jgi:4a-hydroxytetrahydrobiopterin dehydratase
MGPMPPLPDDEVTGRLAELPGWARTGDEIVRTYELPTFPAVIELVRRIADAAEAAHHHPDLDIRYRTLRVALTTHDAGGLTAHDFALATEINRLAG